MSKIERVLVSALFLLPLIGACSMARNYPEAYFAKKDDRYLVQMMGRRRRMAHDPISGLTAGTYEDNLILDVPRIEGIIEGAEIPVKPGYLGYGGSVVITQGKMKVDLYYAVDGPNRPLSWNGEYNLVQKNISEPQEPTP